MTSNNTDSIIQLPEITQETLDKITLTPEGKEFYTQDNEIKRLLIERETYKRVYEEQQKRIDTFTKEWDKIMDKQVTRTHTMRQYVNQEYYKQLFSKMKLDNVYKFIDYDIVYNKNYKFIDYDIVYNKNYKFV